MCLIFIGNLFSVDLTVTFVKQCIANSRQPRIIFILQTHPSKGFQKNMLKAWNFTENNKIPDIFDSSFNGWLMT